MWSPVIGGGAIKKQTSHHPLMVLNYSTNHNYNLLLKSEGNNRFNLKSDWL